MITLIDEAAEAGARCSQTCRVAGFSARTLQRWREDGRQILAIANAPEFAPMAPSQIVPALADRGQYIASESSFYRVLREADQLARRGKAKPPTRQRPMPLQASAPNQL